MINRISLLIFLLFAGVKIVAQGEFGYFGPREITDEMTQDPDQHKKWRKGFLKYPAKPKDAWELGLHGGHFFIDGDSDTRTPGGFGIGFHLRKSLFYSFSIRGDFFYGQAYHVDAQLWKHQEQGGGLVEPVFNRYQNMPGWFPRSKTQYAYGAVQGVLNIGNILFHKESNTWNWYLVLGGGFDTHRVMMDLFGPNGNPYDVNSILDMGLDHNIRSERIMIKKEVDNKYDGEYETEGYKLRGIYRVNDQYNIHFLFTGGTGISRKLSKRVNVSLEHMVLVSDNDYLDGIKFRSAYDQTNNLDIPHYTNLRLAINLGNLSKRSEPLYWLNPLDGAYNDISELKQRPVLDLTDTDADGVVDMLDLEPNSPVGAVVDHRGVTMDSDSDGIPDYMDAEPFSPPGLEVDETGKAAIIKECCITKAEVEAMFKSRGIPDSIATPGKTMGFYSGQMDWFLPMIHFDLDKFSIKPAYYGHLKHVAEVMEKYPDLCVTAYGHTDVRSSNEYNNRLAYNRAKEAIDFLVKNYGIPRERFKLMFGGEEMPLIKEVNDQLKSGKELEMKHYMNRRVEFRTCRETDTDMEAPPSVKNWTKSYGVPSKKTSGKGDKNSGF